jgi:hypothetical protein
VRRALLLLHHLNFPIHKSWACPNSYGFAYFSHYVEARPFNLMIINSTFILFGASYTQDLLINSTSHSHLINQSTYKVLGVSHKTINLHGDYLEHEAVFFYCVHDTCSQIWIWIRKHPSHNSLDPNLPNNRKCNLKAN